MDFLKELMGDAYKEDMTKDDVMQAFFTWCHSKHYPETVDAEEHAMMAILKTMQKNDDLLEPQELPKDLDFGPYKAQFEEEPNEQEEEAYRYLDTFAELAPCPIVEHYWSRYNDPDMGKYFLETVSRLLEKTEGYGFTFCMENAPYKPEINERYPDIKEVADFIKSFAGRMYMTFDVNHANLNEDVLYAVEAGSGLIRHIHVSDNHGHREEHLWPGEGIIDLKSVVDKIYKKGK